MAAASGGAVREVKSKAELDAAVGDGAPVILHFWTSWCEASKHMDQVFSHLSSDFPFARFLRVEAEEQPEISEAYSVSAVPFFVFFKDSKTVDTLEGADPSSLANKVAKIAGTITSWNPTAPGSLGMAAGPSVLETVEDLAKENGSSQNISSSGTSNDLKTKLEQRVSSHPIMLFMKGSPESPKCGFSQKVVDILKKEKVKFGSFDILTDNEVREGLKKFSNWPTFPQLYCKGELLGGCDIAIAMHENGELGEVFRDHGIQKIDLEKKVEQATQDFVRAQETIFVLHLLELEKKVDEAAQDLVRAQTTIDFKDKELQELKTRNEKHLTDMKALYERQLDRYRYDLAAKLKKLYADAKEAAYWREEAAYWREKAAEGCLICLNQELAYWKEKTEQRGHETLPRPSASRMKIPLPSASRMKNPPIRPPFIVPGTGTLHARRPRGMR